MRFLDTAGSGIRKFPEQTTDLDTCGRRWTVHNVIRNQQVSGSSPLAGSNRINNLQRFQCERSGQRVTTVSPTTRRWIDVDIAGASRRGKVAQLELAARSRRGEAGRHLRRPDAELTGEVPRDEGARHGRGALAR